MKNHRLGDNIEIHVSHKGIASTIYKELLKYNNEETNNPVQSEQMVWTYSSSKKIIKIACKYMKKFSTSFISHKGNAN